MATKKEQYQSCGACHGSGGTLTEVCSPCAGTGTVVVIVTPETIVLGEN